MKLLPKILITSLVPLLLSFVLILVQIDQLIGTADQSREHDSELKVQLFEARFKELLRDLDERSELMRELRPVGVAIQKRNLAELYDWATIFSNKKRMMVLIADNKAVVLARSREEFLVGDVLLDQSFVLQSFREGSFKGISYVDSVLSFVKTSLIKDQRGAVIGIAVIALPITSEIFDELVADTSIVVTYRDKKGGVVSSHHQVSIKGQVLTTLHKDLLSEQSLPASFELLVPPDPLNQRLQNLQGSMLIITLVGLVLLPLALTLLLQFHLRPYRRLVGVVERFTQGGQSYQELEAACRDSFADNKHEINNVALAIAGMVASTISNVAKLERLNTKLEHLTLTDPLTGISNRRHLEKILDDEFRRSKRYRYDFVVMMIDIDHFKQINDTEGHAAGDQVLVKLAERTKQTIRETDFFGRLGGEEFLVISPFCDKKAGLELAEKIRYNVQISHFLPTSKVTISIGLACYTSKDKPETLLQRSDKALYKAKESGRNRVETA